MPFTPCHAALALPLLRLSPRYLSGTALIAGSMAPDFEYFFRMETNGIHGHTIPGIFYFDVPVVILLSFLFHNIVKNSLIDNAPVWIRTRLQVLRRFDFNDYFKTNYIAVIVSAVLGTMTHIFWDAFTHKTGYFVHLFDSFYARNNLQFAGLNIPLYKLLQHLSTWVGFVIIVFYIRAIPSEQVVEARSKNKNYWPGIVLITATIFALRFSIRPDDISLGNVMATLISGGCIALLTLGLFFVQRANAN